MQSVLIKVASVAVMVHMAFGCSWHHGFGNAHACPNDSGGPVCQHDEEDACCGDHSHEPRDPGGDSQFPADPQPAVCDSEHPAHNHGRHDCANDRCSMVPQIEFEFSPLDFSIQYLGGASHSALAGSLVQDPSGPVPFAGIAGPACFPAGVRAHLSLNVQLI